MKKIENEKDVQFLVDTFYGKVLKDDTIAFLFTEIAAINIEKHLPKIYGFWKTVLLGTMEYTGNTMGVHWSLHQKHPLKHEYFDRWIHLWEESVTENFEGEKAEEAVSRARNILELMRFKMTEQQ